MYCWSGWTGTHPGKHRALISFCKDPLDFFQTKRVKKREATRRPDPCSTFGCPVSSFFNERGLQALQALQAGMHSRLHVPVRCSPSPKASPLEGPTSCPPAWYNSPNDTAPLFLRLPGPSPIVGSKFILLSTRYRTDSVSHFTTSFASRASPVFPNSSIARSRVESGSNQSLGTKLDQYLTCCTNSISSTSLPAVTHPPVCLDLRCRRYPLAFIRPPQQHCRHSRLNSINHQLVHPLVIPKPQFDCIYRRR
ncbi:hypothetical protein QBC35DRAFT_36061 [Podospora australis]|uniref:Uncharacterized protein n=1 Tax=Podospora australis TaxID=1536484 RepID=A0AAN7AL23_9PEZI|nr:hypothetical protein QBC35DRAFT_36061 [Podospora australis]